MGSFMLDFYSVGCFSRLGTFSCALTNLGSFCLDVRTLTFCQLLGFPLNH